MSDRRGASSVFPRQGRDDELAVALPDDLLSENAEIDEVLFPGNTSAATGLKAFVIQIHQTLNAKKVTQVAVHELRPILGCDRVCFLERFGKRFRLVAASDQIGKPPRSRQASLLEQFIAAVLPTEQRFLFPDDHFTLPEDLSRQLAAYWESANGQMILVEPVFSSLTGPGEISQNPARGSVVGALVIEQFDRTSLKPEAIKRLDTVMEHLTIALANAKKYSRLVAVPGLNQLGKVFELIGRTRSVAILTYFIVIAGFLACATLIERPFEIECDGRLMPTERREAFASFDGEIIEVMVNESDHVEEGQIIACLQSRELEKAILEQTGLLKGKLKSRDAARAELRSRSTPQTRGQSARDQAQLEVINSEIETIDRQLALLYQEQKQLVIRAPISGTITTDRPREKLLGRPVHRGESLFEIMDESGGWQLELAVAETKIGHLLSYQQHHSKINVKFRLLSLAQESFDCMVTRIADRTVSSPELGSCSLVFCDVSRLNFDARQIGPEVSARIRCGDKSLLFIWFHEFWELLQRHWWI